jgi:hypothetical protein
MGEQSGGKEDKGFVVIDRRGREEPEETSPPAEAEQEARAKPGGKEESALPRIDFSTFVLSLSTSALYHLGLVPDPETRKPGPVNCDLARQTIDTLELLAEKTRGNLEPEEKQLLESLLYELHMRYVEAR